MAKTQVRNPLSGEVEHDGGAQVEGASLNGAVAPAGSAARILDDGFDSAAREMGEAMSRAAVEGDPEFGEATGILGGQELEPHDCGAALKAAQAIGDVPGDGDAKPGDRFYCTCGLIYVHDCDEAEGCEWQRQEEPITVTDYDANGEAVDRPVAEAQPELPGMPPALDIWPRFMGRRVASMAFSFSGKPEADSHDEHLIAVAKSLTFGLPVVATIHGQITDINHKGGDTGPLSGTAKVKIGWIDWSGGRETEDEADELRQRIQAALTMLGDAREFVGQPGGEPEDEAEDKWLADIMAILRGDYEGPDPLAVSKAALADAMSTLTGEPIPEAAAELETDAGPSALEEAGAP